MVIVKAISIKYAILLYTQNKISLFLYCLQNTNCLLHYKGLQIISISFINLSVSLRATIILL